MFGITLVVDLLARAGARVASLVIAAAVGDVTGWLSDTAAMQSRVRALVFAADHERLDVIDALVAAGTPIDATDTVWGRQPLRVARENGRTASVEHLLALGADPSAPGGQP